MDNSGPDIVFDTNVEEKSNTVSMSSIISRTPAWKYTARWILNSNSAI